MSPRPRVGAVLALALALVLALCGCGASAGGAAGGAATPTPDAAGEAELPAPDAPLPRSPGRFAEDVRVTTAALDAAVDRWRSEGNPARGGPPEDVELLALHQQRLYRRLGRRPRLSARVLRRLRGALRAEARDHVLARRELGRITSVRRGPPPKIRVGRPQPADVLRRHYRAARRRFKVGLPLLAAVNYVESAFGRLRNRSVSGAQGPMQFIPATWRAYGLGGNIRDPRDAILGAANYLHASGAPRRERVALFHYNPSKDYVSAVARYARRIRADPRAYYELYAWQVFVGDRRLTGPGRDGR